MTVPVPERLFHVVEREVWEEALREGGYRWSTRGVTVEDEGFVHLSTAEQVQGTLQRFYDGLDPLVVLVVDPELTEAEIRLEDGFFHSYGELPIPSVVDVVTVPADRTALVLPT